MRHLFFIPFVCALLLPLLQASASPQTLPPATPTSPGLLWVWEDGDPQAAWWSALVKDDALYATSFGGGVQALDRRTGAPLWTVRPPTPDGVAAVRPLGVIAGRLLVNDDTRLVGLSSNSGGDLWSGPDVPRDWSDIALTAGQSVLASSPSHWNPCPLADRALVTALDLGDGEARWQAAGSLCLTMEQWREHHDQPRLLPALAPVISVDRTRARGVDMASGAELWGLDGPFTAAASSADTVYLVRNDKLIALERGSGAERWRAPVAAEARLRAEAGLAYVETNTADATGLVEAYDGRTGALRWSQAGKLSAVDRRNSYVAEGARLLAIGHETGAPRWSHAWRSGQYDFFPQVWPDKAGGLAVLYQIRQTPDAEEIHLHAFDPLTGAVRWRDAAD